MNNIEDLVLEFIFDSNLSLKAKGLLTMLVLYPNKEQIKKENLLFFNLDGKKSLNTAIRELKDKGYLEILHDKFDYEYVIHTTPIKKEGN